MCGSYFNLEALRRDETPVKSYDIHIYYTPGTAEAVQVHDVWQKLNILFPDAIRDGGFVGKVGPHTRENLDLSLRKEHFGEVVAWLQRHSEGLSILIHPKTGDEWKDHMESAMWIGQPVPFSERFFAPLKPKAPNAPKLS